MKPTRFQQLIAGLAVLMVVAMTLAGGVLLAASDNPEGSDLFAGRSPTATPYTLPTVAEEEAEIKETKEVTPEAATAPPITATPAPTDTPEPTATATTVVAVAPTNTAAPMAAAPAAEAATCVVRPDWVAYQVQPGENLYRIGLRYGLSASAMQAANCLPDTTIEAEQTIRVPYTPSPTQAPPPTTAPLDVPAAAPISGATPTSTGTDGTCGNPASRITSPAVGAVLSGEAAFTGSATHADLSLYKLELRPEGSASAHDFVTAYTGTEPVTNGLLGTINTRAFPNGSYWVRLVVVDSTGNYPEPCSILYTIAN